MKIIKVNYIEGEVRIVVEGHEDKSFCIKLKDQTTLKEITDQLKTMLPTVNPAEALYNSLKIKSLEGGDI